MPFVSWCCMRFLLIVARKEYRMLGKGKSVGEDWGQPLQRSAIAPTAATLDRRKSSLPFISKQLPQRPRTRG